jgi:transposase-like protein
MVKVRALTELKVDDLWQEVKGDAEERWGDLKQETLRMVNRLMERAMEEDLLECPQVGRYLRMGPESGYRNGYRHCNMLTALGLVDYPQVPRDSEGVYQPSVLGRYQHRKVRVNELIREVLLASVSACRVGAMLAPVSVRLPALKQCLE